MVTGLSESPPFRSATTERRASSAGPPYGTHTTEGVKAGDPSGVARGSKHNLLR